MESSESDMHDDATEIVISERDFRLKRIEEIRTAIHEARESGDWHKVPTDVYRKYLAKIIVTTLPTVHGRNITKAMGMITAEGLYSIAMPDFTASDPQTEAAENELHKAGDKTLGKLRAQALNIDADAIVDVRTDHNLIGTEGGQQRFLIVCSGTAVKLT